MRTAVLLAFAVTSLAQAQAPWQFHWQQGQTLLYKVKHHTTVSETAEGSKTETISKLDLVKQWQVVEVDKDGRATLKLTLAALRNEQKRPNGEILLFDSEDLPKSTPELREQMGKFVGQTLAILRVDPTGRVIEVKQGPAARYEAEPPFGLVLPMLAAKEGETWTRSYNIVVEPPQGTGEKYPAEQKYQLTKLDGDKAVIDVKTVFKTPPESVQDRLPLLQRQVDGQVVFDSKTGTLVQASFTIDRTIENHQGAGSSYRLQSKYEEVRVP
jgi:hypothetical protein